MMGTPTTTAAPRGRRRWMAWLSLALIAAGAVLVGLGARDYFGSIWGQKEAEREWSEAQTPASSLAAPAIPDLGTAFAKMSIPRLGSAWFVFEGMDNKHLRLGPVHLRGTALPGTPGNCVIAAHRDTHFRALKDIRTGDEIRIQTRHGEFTYTVTKLSIIKPTNLKPLQPAAKPVMNLITCYPFYYVGPAPKRFIVEAQLRAAS